MTNREKIAFIEEAIGTDKGALSSETELNDIEMWDSVGKLFFMSAIKTTFGKDLAPDDVRSLKTVADMMEIVREAQIS